MAGVRAATWAADDGVWIVAGFRVASVGDGTSAVAGSNAGWVVDAAGGARIVGAGAIDGSTSGSELACGVSDCPLPCWTAGGAGAAGCGFVSIAGASAGSEGKTPAARVAGGGVVWAAAGVADRGRCGVAVEVSQKGACGPLFAAGVTGASIGAAVGSTMPFSKSGNTDAVGESLTVPCPKGVFEGVKSTHGENAAKSALMGGVKFGTSSEMHTVRQIAEACSQRVRRGCVAKNWRAAAAAAKKWRVVSLPSLLSSAARCLF